MEANCSPVLLSVVIPAFNPGPYIMDCLESVLSQSEAPPFEVIVVNDGSTDHSLDCIPFRFPSVRLLHKANGGVGSARNLGVQNASAEVIVFIDADDIMLPGRLRQQGTYMLANPSVGLSFGNLRYELATSDDDPNARLGVKDATDFEPLNQAYERLLIEGNFIGTSATAVRKQAYLGVGGQSLDRMHAEDYACWWAIARNWPVSASRAFMSWYRQSHTGQLSASLYSLRGPVRSLALELAARRGELSPQTYRLVHRRWIRWANHLLGWLWLHQGRHAVLAQLDELRPCLPWRLRLLWSLISLAPAHIGRALVSLHRRAVKRVQSPFLTGLGKTYQSPR